MISEFKIFNRKTGKHAESWINGLETGKILHHSKEPYEELEIRSKSNKRNEHIQVSQECMFLGSLSHHNKDFVVIRQSLSQQRLSHQSFSQLCLYNLCLIIMVIKAPLACYSSRVLDRPCYSSRVSNGPYYSS